MVADLDFLGSYGRAALPEPIRLECVPGRMALGDWSKIDGLRSYSGGAWYRKTVTIPSAKQVVPDALSRRTSVGVAWPGHAAI